MPDFNQQRISSVDVPASNSSRALDLAIDDGLEWLDQEQSDEGYWRGMLESNCCMEAEWIMAFHVMGCLLYTSDAADE